jgi:hypothetical protein
MTLTLIRRQYREDGIFSQLTGLSSPMLTLERSYNLKSKIPIGTYRCVKGMHRLKNMKNPFETFQVMNVPKCTGILFHVGNYNRDSEGCILLGENLGISNGALMLTRSRIAFHRFMKELSGVKEFTLHVIEEARHDSNVIS